MSVFIKKVFTELLCLNKSLVNMVNVSGHTKCISLNKQKCISKLTLININPDEFNQILHYFLCMFNLDRCNGSCNTLVNRSNKVCVPNKTEDLNWLNVLMRMVNM